MKTAQKLILAAASITLLTAFVFYWFFVRTYRVPGNPSSDFIHLSVEGGWGENYDIWIYPDDSYKGASFASDTHKVLQRYRGSKSKIFSSVIRLFDESSVWTFTKKSIQENLARAADRRNMNYGGTDQEQVFLEARSGDKMVSLSFYGLSSSAFSFPELPDLTAFSTIVDEIKYSVGAEKKLPKRRTIPTSKGDNPVINFSPERLGELQDRGIGITYSSWTVSKKVGKRFSFTFVFDYSALPPGSFVEVTKTFRYADDTRRVREVSLSEFSTDQKEEVAMELGEAELEKTSIQVQKRLQNGNFDGLFIIQLKDVVRNGTLEKKP